MSVGKALRLRRLLRKGRAMVVPLDHGLLTGPLKGIEDPVALVKLIAQSDADAVLLTPGILEQVAGDLGQLAVILRVDGCTTSPAGGTMTQFTSVAHAAALGADAIRINVVIGGEQERSELRKLGRVVEEACRWAMPVVAEMLTARLLANQMAFDTQPAPDFPPDAAGDLMLACRVGAEMGADVIMTRYSGDQERFRRTVAATGRPVMVAGGPLRNANLRSLLQEVDECLSAGAEGLVFGRNVWQHPHPAAVLAALAAMVHDDASVEQALRVAERQRTVAI